MRDASAPVAEAGPSEREGAAPIEVEAGEPSTREASAGASEAGVPDADLDVTMDAGSSTSDAPSARPFDGASESGPSPDESMWLTPMNAARAAVGENPLHWDPMAAQVAQMYASQCDYAHNPDAGTEYRALGGASGLGENIAAGAPSQTIPAAVGSWLSEQASYDHATNQCAAGNFGSFAKGVWDFEVCDFSPPGNVNGAPPY